MSWMFLDLRPTNSERAHGRLLIRELFPDPYQPRAKTVIGIFTNATGAKRHPGEWWNDFIIALKKALPDCGLVASITAAGDEAPEHRTHASRLALAAAGLESDA